MRPLLYRLSYPTGFLRTRNLARSPDGGKQKDGRRRVDFTGAFVHLQASLRGSSNGRTGDFGSPREGSNPSPRTAGGGGSLADDVALHAAEGAEELALLLLGHVELV